MKATAIRPFNTRINSYTKSFSFVLFVAAISVLAINFMLYSTGALDIRLPLRILALSFFAFSLLLSFREIELRIPEILLLMFLFVLLPIHGSEELNLILILMFGINSRLFSRDSVIKAFAIISVVSIAVLLALLLAGVIVDHYSAYQGRIRRTIGFEHPNQTALYMSALLMLTFLEVKHKGIVRATVIALLFLVFVLTNSRGLAVFLAALLVFMFVYGVVLKQGISKATRMLPCLVLLCSAAISVSLCLIAGTEIDQLLSYRASHFANYLLSASPADLLLGGDNYSTIDNFYVLAIAMYGIPVLAILLVLIGRALYQIALHSDWYILSVITAVLIYASVESFLLRPELILSLFFWYSICSASINADKRAASRQQYYRSR